ncbi:unnamed protein product [Amaranthus hypochondriacus]
MDESWRKRMGISATGSTSRDRALEPQDFDDVFGGPPRSVLSRKLSADFSGNDWFYNEIFKEPESESPVIISGRRLPGYIIPDRRKSKSRHTKSKSMSISRSKSTCSSVMSFDELNELNNFGSAIVIGDNEDVALSSFTSRLRPINVPSRWTTPSILEMPKSNQNKQEFPSFELIPNECDEYMNTIQNVHLKNDHNIEANNNHEDIDIGEAIAWAKEKFHGWSSHNNAQEC